MGDHKIPFNRPYMTGQELDYIAEAHSGGHLAGDGPFTRRCHAWLEEQTGCRKALLTPSCTAALEMMALLLDIAEGDEVIVPSFTFVSTANAFVLRGGVPVFVDIRSDTLNIDETQIEDVITRRTKAIVPVHYAGVACEMDAIMSIARRHNLAVVEDAAQGAMAYYRGRALGSIGDLGALSFHETKNVISGEGGALLVNTEEFMSRAEILRDKGTNRSRFLRKEVDKYTWQDKGSSYLSSELIAAFLWAQFEEAERITRCRLDLWNHYHESFEPLERRGLLRRPIIPDGCSHNAHMYYVLLPPGADRAEVLAALADEGINAVFHYVPLHDSPAGRRYGRTNGDLRVTTELSSRLIRLPMWVGLQETDQNRVVDALTRILTFRA
ncbi:UDP-4-amino-4-deoxy-L-arabinose--oxoglutarate aminotransferase [Mycobacterium basiliense]|uniref:UDP-4-amino-4-deoxy-L-arabinose--oxoglutarate aminotransferase n=1 Tax=Mycobacterium basiliense TaxID=2094119 RepID=A0A447GDM7_9MYCO|nr:dTDP-4-amino-4,6-dideoxygalactose transaminase [Mycobacterium basiliense]VDM88592.1 UDP-4-amino-4-deoxy-L-arabinose--oxoglutarate aminotransferase [Mycobacterium basiliense]